MPERILLTDEHMCTSAESDYNDIVDGMNESYGLELAHEWENKFISEFRKDRQQNNERAVRGMHQVRSASSCSTRTIPFGREEDTYNDVLSTTYSRYEPVFTKERITDWNQYPPKSDLGEPSRRNQKVRLLMSWCTKKPRRGGTKT